MVDVNKTPRKRPAKLVIPPSLKMEYKRRLTKAVNDDSGNGHEICRVLGEIVREIGATRVAEMTGLGRSALYASFGDKKNDTRFCTVLKIVRLLGVRFSLH